MHLICHRKVESWFLFSANSSKSAFKRAVGHLLKAGLIEEDKTAGTITLIKDPEENDNGED